MKLWGGRFKRRYLFKYWNSLLQDVRKQFKKQLSTIMEEKSVQGCSTKTPLIQEVFEVQICILQKHFGEQPPLCSCCHQAITVGCSGVSPGLELKCCCSDPAQSSLHLTAISFKIPIHFIQLAHSMDFFKIFDKSQTAILAINLCGTEMLFLYALYLSCSFLPVTLIEGWKVALLRVCIIPHYRAEHWSVPVFPS